MYPSCVAAGLSYFRSTNPLLRGNVVVLLGSVMESTRGREMGEELVQATTQGILGLLGDHDREVRQLVVSRLVQLLVLQVRRVAASTVGKVVTSTVGPMV